MTPQIARKTSHATDDTLVAPSAIGKEDVFTIDVEDWFHILEVEGANNSTDWDKLPSRVEANFSALLEMLAKNNVRATCFVLGWIATRFPKLLRDAADLGHDIGSHGFAHQIVHSLSPSEFRDDIRSAKAAIEDAIGRPVRGFRAPGFSITRGTQWAFEEIVEAGYVFDSSVFPARHGHGGIPDAPRQPYVIKTAAGPLLEFPISVVDTIIGPRCFFGGGYLRLAPLWLSKAMASRVRSHGTGVIWYIHPREIDPDHPRLRMPFRRRFKSYVNLKPTREKIESILQTGTFRTFSEIITQS